MAKVSQMQGVSAHLETLKSDGKRRHPSYCKHHEGIGKNRICTNTESPKYNQHCNSAMRCNYYKEMSK